MIKINGEQKDLQGVTLEDYLERSGYDRKRGAVERNGEIVSKAKYSETILKDGDVVEIVSFVGGG